MTVHLDKEQAKQERRRLLGSNDVIYILFHDALKRWQKEGATTLSPVELFLSAKAFTHALLQLPEVMEGIDDEMDDLEEEAESENDAMMVMMLASAMLHAIGTHRVGFDPKPAILAIYSRWSDHRLFFPFLDEGAKKEQARWIEGKRTHLLTYELEEVEKDGEGDAGVRQLFQLIIDPGYHMRQETLKENLLFLNRYNLEHGHAYDKELLAAYEALDTSHLPSMNDNNGIVAGGNFTANIMLTNDQTSMVVGKLAANEDNKLLK